jgi:hypothetical protein
MMEDKFVDFSGLYEYDQLIKQYIDSKINELKEELSKQKEEESIPTK